MQRLVYFQCRKHRKGRQEWENGGILFLPSRPKGMVNVLPKSSSAAPYSLLMGFFSPPKWTSAIQFFNGEENFGAGAKGVA